MSSSLRSFARTLTRPWMIVLLLLVFLTAVGIFSPVPAWAEDPDFTPTGIGGLISTESLRGTDDPTLYEDYSTAAYYFDTNLGSKDIQEKTFNFVANFFFKLLVALIQGTIVVVWTMFSFTDTGAMGTAISSAIGTAASTLGTWILPTALATGALVAFIQQTRAGSGFSQIAWVMLSGLAAVSMMLSPTSWVNTIDQVRTLGSEAVMGATSEAIEGTDTPFAFPEATYTGTSKDTMLRKSADSIWRAYVVTPWCVAEFGSTNACTKYGGYLLANAGPGGVDNELREKYLWDKVQGENGEDSPVYRWTAGHSPIDRASMAFMALIVGAIFAILMLFLAFTALYAFVCALLLLFVGVFFVMLMAIPGKPRRWGLGWLDTLVGLALQSVIATMILSSVLVLTAAALELTADLGWAAAAGVSTLVAVAGFTMRRTVSSIMGALTPGGGMAAALGFAAIAGGKKIGGFIKRTNKGKGISQRAMATDRHDDTAGSGDTAGPGSTGNGPRVRGAGSAWAANYRRSYRTVAPAGRGSNTTEPAGAPRNPRNVRTATNDNRPSNESPGASIEGGRPTSEQPMRRSTPDTRSTPRPSSRRPARQSRTRVARPARPVAVRSVGTPQLRNDVVAAPQRPAAPRQQQRPRPSPRPVTNYSRPKAATARPDAPPVTRPRPTTPRPANPGRNTAGE